MMAMSRSLFAQSSRRRRALFVAASVVAFCTSAFAQNPASTNPAVAPTRQEAPIKPTAFPASKIRESLIAEATAGSEVSWARSIENHLAWVEKANGKKTVRLDSKPVGASYEDVKYVTHSADEQHLAFIAKRFLRVSETLD